MTNIVNIIVYNGLKRKNGRVKYMKRFISGNVFRGCSHADLVNNVLGTRYKSLMRCSVELEDFGAPGVYAWFIFMDDTAHGYEDGWMWRNLLTENGNIIREVNINKKEKLYETRAEVGYRPYRLAFQLDPYETKDRYCCKFVGAFRLKKFNNSDLTTVEYEKVFDDVVINSYGDGYNELHVTKEDFIKESSKYNTKIEEVGFSEKSLTKLKGWGVKTVGELLEIPDGNCSISAEIKQRLYNFLIK